MNEKLPNVIKLKSKKSISELFNSGTPIKAYPLLLVYKDASEIETNFQVGFSVSKRNFKNAVDRNRIKRLLREYFRKNKYIFTSKETNFIGMFIFTSKTKPTLTEVGKAMDKIAHKLKLQLQQN